MQSKNILIGTEYLVDPSTYGNASHGFHAVVLEVGVEHNFGTEYRPKIEKAVKVKFLERGYYSRKFEVAFVRPKMVMSTWAEHVAIEAQKKANRDESIASMQQASKTVARLTGKKQKDLPYGLQGTIEADGSYGTQARISVHELAKMLQAAYDLGKSEA